MTQIVLLMPNLGVLCAPWEEQTVKTSIKIRIQNVSAFQMCFSRMCPSKTDSHHTTPEAISQPYTQ